MIRINLGLTQSEFGRLVGVGENVVKLWERGQREVRWLEAFEHGVEIAQYARGPVAQGVWPKVR